MSYAISLIVKEGKVTVNEGPGSTFGVPDGQFVITGHIDTAWESLGVSRKDPLGFTKTTTSASTFADETNH